MARNEDMVNIVHRRATHPLVVPGESHRFDQVDRYAHAGAEPHDRPDIAGDLRFKEGDAHDGGRLGKRCPRCKPAASDRQFRHLQLAVEALSARQLNAP